MTEQMHQTIISQVQTNLLSSKLLMKLWGEAINYITFIHN